MPSNNLSFINQFNAGSLLLLLTPGQLPHQKLFLGNAMKTALISLKIKSTKVTVRMGLHAFLSAVRMVLWYCTDGSSWVQLYVGNHSASMSVTFVIQYDGTLSKVGKRILYDMFELTT